MNIRMNLLAITVAICTGSSSAKGAEDDFDIPGPLATLTYQDQLRACSYFFEAKATVEANFDDNIEIRKFAVTRNLRNMNLVMVPQNELIPGPRNRGAKAIGEATARSNDAKAEEAMDRYCFRAMLAGTRWMSKDDLARVERSVEFSYVQMRAPFSR